MKLGLATLGALTFAGGIASVSSSADQMVILAGDARGYLSPCGCSSPMMGGIRRQASVVRGLSRNGHTTFLVNGGFVEGAGRQDQMKAETLAQSYADLDVAAVNVGPLDAGLGPGELEQVSRLSGGKLVSLSVAHPGTHALGDTRASGPFLIGGATDSAAVASILGDSAVPLEQAVQSLVDAAAAENLKPVLMLQGGRDSAMRLGRAFPQLALIQYSSGGEPPAKLEFMGSTALATTGEHGKHLVRVTFRNGAFIGYERIALGPGFKDDPTVSRYYSAYLRRVGEEKLLDRVARSATSGYSGSWACAACHREAGHTWKLSDHRSALGTLEKQGHALDPDCVSCHVTGLSSTQGYRSIKATPELAGVGCESCHGPGLAHAKSPKSISMPRLTAKACTGCHNPLNSPNFDFAVYWPKIRHR